MRSAILLTFCGVVLILAIASALLAAANKPSFAPCVEYVRDNVNGRFVVLECIQDGRAAYIYDQTRKKCFLLTGSVESHSMASVTCDNLPGPK